MSYKSGHRMRRRPSAPASSAVLAKTIASLVPYPTPATTGSLPFASSAAAQPLGNAARTQLSLAEQIGLVLADVFGTQLDWRTTKVAGKIFHRMDVTLDGRRGVI